VNSVISPEIRLRPPIITTAFGICWYSEGPVYCPYLDPSELTGNFCRQRVNMQLLSFWVKLLGIFN